jgi:3-hydroxyisobutyrate dehydrogenase-like beta-hydroxyacid dehydrogenase
MSDAKSGPVGIIGLGIMGSALAGNLLKAGFEVMGMDIVPEARARLTKAGGNAVASAREVGEACRYIILSLASEAALYEVCGELATSCAKDTIVLETGTLPLAAKQKMLRALAEHGVILLDSPLSGTGAQARERDLAVYASGDSRAIKRARPIIDAFARVCYDVGEFGNGMKMKFIANLLGAIHNIAAAEAILFGVRSGLDPMTVVKVIGDGAGTSRMLQVRGPMMAKRSWAEEVTMKNSTWQKDMKLIGEALQAVGCPAPLFSACVPIYIAATTSGHAHHDTGAVYEVLERMTLDPAAARK